MGRLRLGYLERFRIIVPEKAFKLITCRGLKYLFLEKC